jgi:hypothetical protein
MAIISPDRAAYRVLNVAGFYADDHLFPVESKIYFDGTPNEDLEPLNELAFKRLKEYVEHLDNLGREAAQKAGKPFVGRPRSLDGQLELATAVQRAEQSIMGVKRSSSTAETIEDEEEIPETGLAPSHKPKNKVGRPSKSATGLITAIA